MIGKQIWQRRFRLPLAFAATMLLIFWPTALAQATVARYAQTQVLFTPPVTCDAAHEGWTYFDGIVTYSCTCVFDSHNHLICSWWPFGVLVREIRAVYYGSNGHTQNNTAFGSNPDYASAMTHSRNVDGSRRVQGSGELRSRVLFQKWNGSAWVNCVDSGYSYSSGAMSEWGYGFNMGSAADCGAGTYRVQSFGNMYDGGWLGSSYITATCARD